MIALEGVEVAFDGRTVLGPIDLRLEAGMFLGLIGPPGSGKSVLLKTIAGLVLPSRGRVVLFGEDTREKSDIELGALRQRIGMVFQNNALFDSKTIADNVAFPLERRGDGDVDAKVKRSLAAVEIEGTGDLFPFELSGGMQKRAGIARATVFDPLIRLYDEPTAGLDPVTSARILRLIESIHRTEPGVSIVISNEMRTMLEFVPRVVMLLEGRVVFDGLCADLDSGLAPEIARRFARGDVNAPI